MSKVTIEHISRHTGLSRGTISRALNDRPDISEKTKRRVLEACAQLKYAPSHAARSLATGRNFAVAVLLDSFHAPFSAAFLRGATACAASAQNVVHPLEIGSDPAAAAECLTRLGTDRIDSVVSSVPLETTLATLLRDSLGNHPVAGCAPIAGLPCDVLAPDHIEAGRLSARHVLKSGARDVIHAYVDESPAAADQVSGFQEICREHGIDANHATIRLTRAGSTGRLDLSPLRAMLDRVEAIIAGDDALAFGVMLLCASAGRTPGEDIAIIGHGNHPIGEWACPTLSTVDMGGVEIGRRAMDVVLQRVAKTRLDAPQTIKVPPKLVVRETTQTAAGR